ncbi:MAG: hypothetical protein ABIJ81_04465 [Patescibacteria group bacterium]
MNDHDQKVIRLFCIDELSGKALASRIDPFLPLVIPRPDVKLMLFLQNSVVKDLIATVSGEIPIIDLIIIDQLIGRISQLEIAQELRSSGFRKHIAVLMEDLCVRTGDFEKLNVKIWKAPVTAWHWPVADEKNFQKKIKNLLTLIQLQIVPFSNLKTTMPSLN